MNFAKAAMQRVQREIFDVQVSVRKYGLFKEDNFNLCDSASSGRATVQDERLLQSSFEKVPC